MAHLQLSRPHVDWVWGDESGQAVYALAALADKRILFSFGRDANRRPFSLANRVVRRVHRLPVDHAAYSFASADALREAIADAVARVWPLVVPDPLATAVDGVVGIDSDPAAMELLQFWVKHHHDFRATC